MSERPTVEKRRRKVKAPPLGWAVEPDRFNDKGLPVIVGYTIHDWTCPYCGNRGYESCNDQSGDTVKCRDCDKPFELGYVR